MTARTSGVALAITPAKATVAGPFEELVEQGGTDASPEVPLVTISRVVQLAYMTTTDGEREWIESRSAPAKVHPPERVPHAAG